jgi:translation initiation factor IF-3
MSLKELRVVGTGGSIGVMEPKRALAIAKEQGLVLVEVSPSAQPPVWKLLEEVPQPKQQQQQQQQQQQVQSQPAAGGAGASARRKARPGKPSKPLKVKEVRLTDRISDHDAQVKLANAIKFLTKGNVVKVIALNSGHECAETKRPRAYRLVEHIVEACKHLADSSGVQGGRLRRSTAGVDQTKLLGEVSTMLTPSGSSSKPP